MLYGITLIYPIPGQQVYPQERGYHCPADELWRVVHSRTRHKFFGRPSALGGSHLHKVRPPLTGPTVGAFMNWQNNSTGGTHRGAVKKSARPPWVDLILDCLIKGSGRSCSPQGNRTGLHPIFVVSFTPQTSSSRPPPTTIGGLWTFQVRFWGGHAPKPNPKDRALRTQYLRQEGLTRVWPGGRRCGWECSPITLVA